MLGYSCGVCSLMLTEEEGVCFLYLLWPSLAASAHSGHIPVLPLGSSSSYLRDKDRPPTLSPHPQVDQTTLTFFLNECFACMYVCAPCEVKEAEEDFRSPRD